VKDKSGRLKKMRKVERGSDKREGREKTCLNMRLRAADILFKTTGGGKEERRQAGKE
jgi:hypothetical protein